MKFEDLLKPASTNPAEQQRLAKLRFPDLVREHSMRLWKPGDSYSTVGVRFLLGVAASYSVPELELLDRVAVGVSKGTLKSAAIDIFDMSTITDVQDFDLYIPDIGRVTRSPLLGIWIEGRLIERAEGFAATQRVLRALENS